MLRLFLMVAVIATVITPSALAQRDAGAKARGEFGKGFWHPDYSHSRGTSSRSRGDSRYRNYSYSRRPAGSSSSSAYRTYSYEPVGINPGDKVAVKGDSVKLMSGRQVVGQVGQDQQFEVTKVIDGWLGANLEVNGKKLKGWIWHKHVTLSDERPGLPK